jgi:hypothetical protein
MIIYEVELWIDPTIEEEFLPWLQQHVNDMLEMDGFLSAQVEEVTEPVSEYLNILCRYSVRSELDLFDYLEINAPLMRQEGIDRFGDQFKAKRRICKRRFASSNPDALQHPHEGETSN